MLLRLQIILLASLLLLSPVLCDNDGHSEASSVWITQSQCRFFFQEHDNNFLFLNCSALQFFSNQWTQCYSHCCSSYPQIAASYEAVATCAGLVKSSLNPLIIALPAAGAVLLIVALCCICRKCRKEKPLKENPEKESQWENQTDINVDLNIAWSKNADPSRKMPRKEQPCAVCLESGPSAELACGHRFHPHCIGGWLRKSTGCPCCRQEVQTVKVFCRGCKWRYYMGDKILMAQQAKLLPVRCPECLQVISELSGSVGEITANYVPTEVIQVRRNEMKSEE